MHCQLCIAAFWHCTEIEKVFSSTHTSKHNCAFVVDDVVPICYVVLPEVYYNLLNRVHVDCILTSQFWLLSLWWRSMSWTSQSTETCVTPWFHTTLTVMMSDGDNVLLVIYWHKPANVNNPAAVGVLGYWMGFCRLDCCPFVKTVLETTALRRKVSVSGIKLAHSKDWHSEAIIHCVYFLNRSDLLCQMPAVILLCYYSKVT